MTAVVWIVGYLVVGVVFGLLHEEYFHQRDGSPRQWKAYVVIPLICSLFWPLVIVAKILSFH